MRQVDFFCNIASAQATSSLAGAFELPAWAPDIAWMTASASNLMPLAIETYLAAGTTLIQVLASASAVYSARRFAIRACPYEAIGRVKLTYEAVGDLVRT